MPVWYALVAISASRTKTTRPRSWTCHRREQIKGSGIFRAPQWLGPSGGACDSRGVTRGRANVERYRVSTVFTKCAAVFWVLVALGNATTEASDFLARFEGGIGVTPVQNGAGPANADTTLPNVRLNVVRGVAPGAGPWRIADLRADIDVTGRIRVRGRGLLLASTDSIGTNANQKVFATLICDAKAPFVQHSTASTVPLEPNGDFRIDDVLTTVPDECPSPVLLIRNAGGVWFAAGVPKGEDE